MPDLALNTISTNHAPEGAAVYCIAARPMLFHNLIWQNEHYYWPVLYFGSSKGAVTLEICWDLDVYFNYFVANAAPVACRPPGAHCRAAPGPWMRHDWTSGKCPRFRGDEPWSSEYRARCTSTSTGSG